MAYWKFICTEKTESECLLRGLFGHTSDTIKETGEQLDISQGDTLFFHRLRIDGSDQISGPFVAESAADENLEDNAWVHKSGSFTWQVRIDWHEDIYSTSVRNINSLEDSVVRIEDHPQKFSNIEGPWLEGKIKKGFQIASYP